MSEPRIFISSTYSDLKDIRDEISSFTKSFGYVPITFEKNDIPFLPNSTIEDSCYDEIKSCTMFILIIRNKFGAEANTLLEFKSSKEKYSVTRNEYVTAKNSGIPIIVFIDNSTFDEYHSWLRKKKKINYEFNYIDSIDLALFIDDIYHDKSFRFLHGFDSVDVIKKKLTKQWAGLFNKYLISAQKYSLRKGQPVYINPFKLFYFRRNLGISQESLGRKIGIKKDKIRRIENAGIKDSHVKVEDFETLNYDTALKMADILQCGIGNIKAGLPDDYLSGYLHYYFKNKGTSQRRKYYEKPKSLFKTKVVVFDFDGTLTKPDKYMTTWELIWVYLGYDIEECSQLHTKFTNLKITHKKWCEITEKKFKAKNLAKEAIDEITDSIKLVDDTAEVIRELYEDGIKLYICSGSIRYIIKRVLGDLYHYFEEVKANDLIFDSNNKLKSIIGTKYDFEGKADFMSQVIKENGINDIEALFVGNSQNDEHVHQSGALTLLVNPSLTNPDHPFRWTYRIRKMDSLKSIEKYLNK